MEFKIEEVEVTMRSMTIELPETVFSALRKAPAEFLKEMRIEAVLIRAQNKQPISCDRTHTPIANNPGLADGA